MNYCIMKISTRWLHTSIMFFIIGLTIPGTKCVLFPFESEIRETKTLNGLWNFQVVCNKSDLITNLDSIKLSKHSTIKMPVPSSYNDITTITEIRDHVGWVVYEREFYVPRRWKEDNVRVFIHFGGVHYFSVVFVNNIFVGTHKGGHIAFEMDVTYSVIPGLNNITIAVNNTLTDRTLPQGSVKHFHPDWHPTGFTTYTHNCDYFDYAGINRPVTLFTTPYTYICDIAVETTYKVRTGYVAYSVKTCEEQLKSCNVELLDEGLNIVANASDSCLGILEVNDVNLWWPAMSNHEPGYLYTLVIRTESDLYKLPVGIRTLKWDSSGLLINDEPIYLRGFGMHEDSDIRGRGFDNAVLSRDMNLMKWIGINSFRTSHYPYADETLNEADSRGILVILETPGCSIDNFNCELLTEHIRILQEIMNQHKNRPSVIMWSLANEPETNQNSSALYFKQLVDLAHLTDKTRPVTFVTSQFPENDQAVQFVDIICVNRYFGWYSYPGNLDLIQDAIIAEITKWYKMFNKPVIVTEYGADSYSGQHKLPSSMWTEDYQVFLLQEHFKAFDRLRGLGYFIGEMIWNFIDFNVPQEYFRPGYCDKGLFTRNRQPKAAAYLVKERYHALCNVVSKNLTMDNVDYYEKRNDVSITLV